MFRIRPRGDEMVRAATRNLTEPQAHTQLDSEDVAEHALAALRCSARLNLVSRVLLTLLSVGAAVLAVVYVYGHADATVDILRRPGADGLQMGERLLVLSAPVLLLTLLAGLAGVSVAFVHARGIDESVHTLDSVNRLRREGEVAVSARGLIVAFEDQLATARRAHTLLLWLGRTLFIVTLGLFLVSAIDAALNGVDLLTAGMGATSLATAVFTVARGVPRTVAHDVANVCQMQLIVTSAHRQISLLESDAFAFINSEQTADADSHRVAMEVQERIERVFGIAIEQIERYTDPSPESKQAKVIEFPPLSSARAA